uniref:WGS project CAEQ00000000 data, annotated contig 1816 n=1 Tax=Trypanosoma congolense (strain IL3000) TaxID=1068625 RepID=F9W949_TRYCI|nr:unnamed protein product [Trypanosoma congolense IL3000]
MAGYIRMDNSDRNSIYFRIRPYANRELELAFCPGLKGSLEEHIQFTNILNPRNEVVMTVKATVTKAETFDVSPDSWSFGLVPVPMLQQNDNSCPTGAVGAESATAKGSVGTVQDESGRPAVRVGARFTVSNTSSTRRALRLKLDSTPNIAGGNAGGGGEWTPCQTDRFFKFEGIDVRLQLDMEHGGSCSGSSRKLEEKIEKLEQKLKIYHRKNKADKVTAAVRQIEELKRALKGEVVVINDPEQTEDEMKGKDSHQCQLQSAPSHTTVSGDEGDESSATTKVLLREHGELLSMLLRDGIALSEINAGESVILVLGITCVRTCEHIPAAQSGTITFVLYEANDTEASRAIPVDITLIRVEGETDVKTSAPAELMAPSGGKRQSESGPGEVLLSPTHLRSPRSSSRPKSDTQSPLHASGELPGGATNQARPAAAASAGSPSFITLELGEGVASSTFMCFPMISVNNCMVQEQYEFTFFVCASGDTSVVVQDPIRCCSPNLVNGNNFGGDNDNCGEVASMKHMVPVITADGNESFLPPVLPTLPTAVKTLDAHFSFSRQGGAVPSRQPLPIIVRCIPVCGGPQHYFIPVTNLQDGGNTTYLVVFLNPILASELMLKVSPSTLFMPDIILPYEGGLPDVQSFTVRSNIVQSHALLIRSNRPSLVRLFEDAKCNVPLRNPIRCPSAQKKTRLYVQFCPSAHLRRHSSRMMSAGILIEAITPTGGSSQSNNTDLDHTRQWGYAVLSHCIVRVSARVGSGDLVLRESFIDLGAVDPSCQKTEATVTVWNPSDHFEIHGRLSASLPLTEISVPEFKLSPGEMIDVPITLHLPAPGLVRESISLHNLSCGQKPLKARLTVLRHDEAISVGVSPYGTLGRSSFSLASASQGLGCSVVVFPTAPVVLGDGGVFRLHSPVISTAMHITNNSMRCLILVARSSVPFVFGPADRTSHASDVPMDCEDGLGSMFAPSTLDSSPSSTTVAEIEVDPDVEDKTSSHSCARGRLLLEAQQTQSVAWTLTALPPLTLKQRQQLQQREVVTVEATAYVYVGQVVDEAFAFPFNDMFFAARQLPVAEQCVLIPKFLLNFALSEGRVEPPLIDLGVVVARNNGTASAALTSSGTENPVPFASTKVTGDVSEQGRQRHLASVANPVPWSEGRDGGGVNPVVFMHLVNLSPILPLQLSVECPPTVHFAHNRITVPPSQTLTVEAIVLPKLIQSQGPFRIAVYFVNEQNPENDMVVYVTGLCYRKLFKLSWEGSVNDGKESLSMQPLRLENLGDAVSAVLSQTKITMTAVEPNIEVGVRVTVNPKLEGVLQLQAQQYGASAPLQTIIFGHAQPVAVGGNANINTNSNNNAGGVVTGVAVGGNSIAASAAATSGGAITNTQLPALGHSAHGAGWAGGGVGPGGMNNGCGNGSEGALIPAVPGKGVVVCTKDHQSFRLRCILAKEDFAALAGVFFGQRKHMSTSDIIHKRQELTFDKLEEIKEQRSAVSKTMWLGTMYFSNRLTGNDEEVQIFSTLSAFCTFKVTSKLLLRPRCPATAADTVEYWETCGLAIAHVGIRATASDALHVYEGELVVCNPCQEHTVRLSITPLLNHAHHDRVALQCIPLDERTAATGKESSSACVSISSGCPGDCKDDVVDANRSGIVSPTPAISPSPCHPPEGELVASQKFNDSSAVTHKTTVIVSVPPQGEVRARVLLYVDGALNKSSVEQAAGIALFDESVSSSAAAVRVSLAPMDENVRERQQQQQADQLFRQSARHVDPLSGVISSSTSHKGAKDGMVEADKGIISAECKVSSGYNTAGKDVPDASSSGDRKTRWSPSATRTRVRRVLTLHGNCAEMPDCSGAYTCSFSFSKDSPPTTDITISNNISDTEVEYTVAVLSQGPQPWLLLPVASAVLGPGENQPLRLNILSTDAGSFVGHIVISSSAAPGEPLLLRLNAEVFLPTAGEGLFDILSSNGQRLSSGMEKEVFVGRLFGEKTHCAYVALEIVNRSSVPLEFPVSVGKSLRIEFVNIPGEEVSEKGNAAAVGATDGNLQQGFPKMRESDDDELGRELREASNNSNNNYGSKGGSNPPTAVASPRCCVRLLVCHLHGVSAMRGERYFVVDPKSRVKVAFLLVCDQLSLPGGLLASGEAEVVLTCKQARDARFVFRTRFQVCRPSFAVQQEHIFTQNEKYTVGLVVKNLCQRESCVLFRTASPMLVVEETPDRDGERSYTMVTIAGGATATINVQLHISNLAALYNWGGANCGGNGGDDRPSSVGNDVNVLLQPVSDHGVLLNVRNPSERVRVEFCYAPPATIQESPGLFLSEIEAVVAYPYSKSAKLARRLNYEKWLYQFFQDFTRVLSEVAELLLPEIREYALCEGLDLPSLCDTTGAATSNGRSGLFNSHRDSTDRAFAASSGSAGSPVNTNVCSGSVISSGEQSGGKDDFPEGSGVESFGDHGIVEDRMAKGGRHAHCRQVLRKLLVDLSWLVEELVYYSIMLGNSRAIEAYSVLLSTFVGNHQLLRAWQQHRGRFPLTHPFAIFEQFIETIDALPR